MALFSTDLLDFSRLERLIVISAARDITPNARKPLTTLPAIILVRSLSLLLDVAGDDKEGPGGGPIGRLGLPGVIAVTEESVVNATL